MALKRFVDGAAGPGILPEARPEIGPPVRAHGGAVVSLRPHRGRGGGRQSRRAGVGDQPRLHRPQPASGALRRSRAPGRAARRPRSGPRACRGPTCARWRWSSARCWRSSATPHGRRRPARAASTCTSGSSRAGASPRCGAPRWRWRARSNGARRTSRPANGGRRSGTASSSTTTRMRRTAPWHRPTRFGPSRPPRSAHRSPGTRCPTRSSATSRSAACRTDTHASATSAPGSTSGPSRSSRCSSS